jgi:hypothetical protein
MKHIRKVAKIRLPSIATLSYLYFKLNFTNCVILEVCHLTITLAYIIFQIWL